MALVWQAALFEVAMLCCAAAIYMYINVCADHTHTAATTKQSNKRQQQQKRRKQTIDAQMDTIRSQITHNNNNAQDPLAPRQQSARVCIQTV